MDNSLKKIPSKEITFVLQGPIISEGHTTKKSCELMAHSYSNIYKINIRLYNIYKMYI